MTACKVGLGKGEVRISDYLVYVMYVYVSQ